MSTKLLEMDNDYLGTTKKICTILKHMHIIKKALMGYQTYVSMLKYFPSGKLPFSDIYIASRKQTQIKNALIISDVKSFLENFNDDLMVIGGAQIYKIALDYADELRITYVLKPYVGDTFFP